jgi:hypothetical protein
MEKGTKTEFYRSVFKRGSYLKSWFLTLATFLTSYPRMMIEVFIRRNFGCRYFNYISVITLAVLLYIIPYNLVDTQVFGSNAFAVIQANWAWYAFIGAFLTFGTMRWLEIRQAPSTFNFSKFTQYMGDVSPLKDMLGVNLRVYEIVVEPAMFFIIGMVFHWMGQSLGMLLILASILYSCSYMAAYMSGDDAIMDMIDEVLFNQNIKGILMEDNQPVKANGVQLRGNMPASKPMRQSLLNSIAGEEDGAVAV